MRRRLDGNTYIQSTSLCALRFLRSVRLALESRMVINRHTLKFLFHLLNMKYLIYG